MPGAITATEQQLRNRFRLLQKLSTNNEVPTCALLDCFIFIYFIFSPCTVSQQEGSACTRTLLQTACLLLLEPESGSPLSVPLCYLLNYSHNMTLFVQYFHSLIHSTLYWNGVIVFLSLSLVVTFLWLYMESVMRKSCYELVLHK